MRGAGQILLPAAAHPAGDHADAVGRVCDKVFNFVNPRTDAWLNRFENRLKRWGVVYVAPNMELLSKHALLSVDEAGGCVESDGL